MARPTGTGLELREGAVLPDFTLHKFPSGDEVNASSIDAKVVLVNFWATWCEACVTEMPSIVKLREGFKNQGFEVVAVDMDENPTVVMPKALKAFKIDFPVFMDSDAKLSETFDVRAIPFTVVMDRNRKILMLEAGGRDWNSPEVLSMMRTWLAG
jgi:thiol-disulfide isomerase/thioredoxin